MTAVIIPGKTMQDRLLSKQRIEVRDVGDRVELTIGNSTVGFDYETALRISAWMRMHAKRAKATAGDQSRSWRALAILDGFRR